jgi:hypothetical protein
MKKMTIYTNSSVHVYEDIYIKYLFEMTDKNQLIITRRDGVTGMENIHACFNSWDYFLLEEEEA